MPLAELLVAASEATDGADLAGLIRVEYAELNHALATDAELRRQLREARAAADELRATQVLLAAPAATARIVRLMKRASPRDSVSLGAAQAVLHHAERVRKADLEVETPDAPKWPNPGPLPVRLLPHGARQGLAVVPKPKEG